MTAHKNSSMKLAGNQTSEIHHSEIVRPEQLLLQSLILKPQIFDDLGDMVLAIDFADAGYAGLFVALQDQYKTSGDVDIEAALVAFRKAAGLVEGSHDDGCLSEIIAMLNADLCTWWHWPYFAKRVTDNSYRRRLVAIAEANTADANDALLSADQVVRNCEARARKLRDRCRIETKAKSQVGEAEIGVLIDTPTIKEEIKARPRRSAMEVL